MEGHAGPPPAHRPTDALQRRGQTDADVDQGALLAQREASAHRQAEAQSFDQQTLAENILKARRKRLRGALKRWKCEQSEARNRSEGEWKWPEVHARRQDPVKLKGRSYPRFHIPAGGIKT